MPTPEQVDRVIHVPLHECPTCHLPLYDPAVVVQYQTDLPPIVPIITQFHIETGYCRGTQRMLLHQVLHDEPRPPRSLNDRIPRDLETVCLKAMAKELGRRYPTAREMADDLRRWLKGEPIHARPVGTLERGWRWAKRRPAVAALLGVSGVTVLALVGLVIGAAYNVWLQEEKARTEAALKEAEALWLAGGKRRPGKVVLPPNRSCHFIKFGRGLINN